MAEDIEKVIIDDFTPSTGIAGTDILYVKKGSTDTQATADQIKEYVYPPEASKTEAGLVSTTDQAIAGRKTFSNGIATPSVELNGVTASGIDSTPTVDSTNLITSNGVYNGILNYGTNITSDCNDVKSLLSKINSNTLNTPYKQGITTATSGIVLSTELTDETSSRCVQICFISTSNSTQYMFKRYKTDATTWTDWVVCSLS